MLNVVDKIIYKYMDSSVPPQYHRSYTITLNSKNIKIVVDSYGDILNDKSFEIREADFRDIKEAIVNYRVVECVLPKNESCTGGTGEKIELYNGKTRVFKGNIYHCGGVDSGNLCGDIKKFAKKIESLIPNIQELLR